MFFAILLAQHLFFGAGSKPLARVVDDMTCSTCGDLRAKKGKALDE